MNGLKYHLQEFKKVYSNLELLCICLQGSQNYGLDIYTDNYKSDIVNAKKHGVKHVVFNTALHKYNLWTPKLENNPILSSRQPNRTSK